MNGRIGKDFAFRVVKSVPIIVGCSLFLFSTILPFYRFSLVSFIETNTSILYWSFKSEVQTFSRLGPFNGNPLAVRESWFHDHWFNYYISRLGLSWVMISMFIIQLLILVTGTASILTSKKVVAIAPVTLCPIVTALMVYANAQLQASTWALNSYQLGYWLTYPSILLFIVNFLLKVKFDKSF